MEQMKQYFMRDPYAKHSGMELVEVSPGHAVTRMQVQDHHLNSFGWVHGGAIFTLADYAFSAAANSHGTLAVAINVSISFLKAAAREVVTATATEVSCGKRIGTYEITVTNEAGQLLATFHGMVYRKGDPIDWSK